MQIVVLVTVLIWETGVEARRGQRKGIGSRCHGGVDMKLQKFQAVNSLVQTRSSSSTSDHPTARI